MSKLATIVSCIFLVTLVVSLIIIPYANALTSTWNKTYGGSSNDRAFSLIKTQEGGYALLGTSMSFSVSGLVSALLVTTDADGNLLWNQTYAGLGATYPDALVQTSDGGYALAGYTYTIDGTSSSSPWFAKTDSAGNLQWNKTYNELGSLIGNLVQTSDGGYALVGFATISDQLIQAWLAKTDANGTIQWKQTYGTSGENELYTIIQTSDGGYTLGGYTTSTGAGQNDFWIIKTDSNGTMLWNYAYGTSSHDMLSTFVQTSDGGYALFGYSNSSSTSTEDFMMIKISASGILEWTKIYEDSNIDEAFSGIQTSDGGYALAGVTAATNGTVYGRMIKTDTDGGLQWSKTYGASNENVLYTLVEVTDGGYVLTGFTKTTASSEDYWLLKTDQNGVVPASSEPSPSPTISEFPGLLTVPLLAACTIIAALVLRKTVTRKTQ